MPKLLHTFFCDLKALNSYFHLHYGLMSVCVNINAKQKQPGCKTIARPIRSHNGYKRPKPLISSKAKKLNILLRILLLE